MTIELDTDVNQGIAPVDAEVSSSDVADDDMQKPIYNKIQLQDIVKREKQKAYERATRDIQMDLQQQQETPPVQQQNAPASIGGMPQMSPDAIKQLIAEHLPQQLQEHIQHSKNEQMVNSFVSKMQAAEQKYPGLEEKLNMLDYSKPGTRAIVEMANSLENTGDIMNELIENPEKMGSILNLVYEQPRLAQQKLASLSNSIKQNQAAIAQHQDTQNPIGQMKPSANAGMDNGNMSVSDYSKYFKQNKM